MAMLFCATAYAQQAPGKKRAARSVSFTNAAAGPAVSFTNATSFTGLAYAWDFGDNSASSNQKNPTHTYTKDGIYNVCLTVTDSLGNRDFTCQQVTVSGTGILQHNLTANLLIYPNPSSSGIVTLDFTKCNVKDVTITVYNITGKTVYERMIKSALIEKHVIDLTEEPSGNYFMTIKAGQETITKRVMIK